MVSGGVIDELPEVRSHRGFPAADVDVEDLHALKFVDDRYALFGREFAGSRLPDEDRQCTGQVAGVGELPGQADRSVESALELLDERGHRRTSISESASTASARRYGACCSVLTPAAANAERASQCSASGSTTARIVRFFRKRQFAGAEVVQQRAEGLRAHRNPEVRKAPAEGRVENRPDRRLGAHGQ